MQDDYTLLTPENVELRYPIAGVGSRLVAASIDYTILVVGEIVISFAVVFFAALLARLFPLPSPDSPAGATAASFASIGFAVILIFLAWWGYFVLFELIWNGQTPGKRMLGIRVVRADGQSLSAGTSLVRNALRAIDVFLLIGVLVMLLDGASRRLGDFAAGSLVVREPRRAGADELERVHIPPAPADRVDVFPNPGGLTMQHYILVRDYFSRRDRMPDARADALAADLARRLARALDVPLGEVGDANDFLATAARAFELRHQRRE
jgi:uncharacterized RDD family membrane protein YckC